MEGRGLYLRVGVLLVVGAAVLVAFVVFLTGAQFSSGRLYESYFGESVQGLSIGTEVKYRGVTLGAVTDIGLTGALYGGTQEINPKDPLWQQVVVRYRIDIAKLGKATNIATDIAAGLRARLASQGLTGLVYIELDFVPHAPQPPEPPWAPVAIFIPTVPSTYSRVQDAVQGLAARVSNLDIEGLVNNLNGLSQDLRAQVHGADLAATLAASRDLLVTLQEQVKQANLPALAADLRETSAAARDTLQGRQMKDILANIDAATAKLGPLLSQAQTTLQRTDAATSDVSSSLSVILTDAQTAMANLRELSENLRRDPGQVLFGAPPPRRQPAPP